MFVFYDIDMIWTLLEGIVCACGWKYIVGALPILLWLWLYLLELGHLGEKITCTILFVNPYLGSRRNCIFLFWECIDPKLPNEWYHTTLSDLYVKLNRMKKDENEGMRFWTKDWGKVCLVHVHVIFQSYDLLLQNFLHWTNSRKKKHLQNSAHFKHSCLIIFFIKCPKFEKVSHNRKNIILRMHLHIWVG